MLAIMVADVLIPRPYSFYLVWIAVALAAFFLVTDLIRSLTASTKVTINPAVGTAALVFGVLAIPGLLNPPVTQYGQEKFTRLLTLTLFAAVTAAIVRNPRDLGAFAMVWLLAGSALAVVALGGAVHAGRAIGFGSNPIWLGRAIGAAIIFLIWMHGRGRIRSSIAAFLLLLLAFGLIATGSRGPLAATVVGTLVLAASGGRKVVARLATAGAAGAAVFVVLLPVLPVTANARLGRFFADPEAGLVSDPRTGMLGPTLSIIEQYPNGVGYGNWSLHAQSLADYPHNLWLEVLAEGGWLIGGVLILAVALTAARLWRAAKTTPEARLLLGLLVFQMIAVSVSGDLNSRPFFIFLALSHVVLRWKRDGQRQDFPSGGPLPARRPTVTLRPLSSGTHRL